jgi:hypothetical protein
MRHFAKVVLTFDTDTPFYRIGSAQMAGQRHDAAADAPVDPEFPPKFP